jgi:riboflavin synthase
MFTGLVEALGTVCHVQADNGGGQHLFVSEAKLVPQLALGDSVAVNGACLTVVDREGDVCRFQAGPETLGRTNLGEARVGDRVNLERALRLSDRLGGHLLQGHVDAQGKVVQRVRQGDWETFWFGCPAELSRFMVPKGSIAVDGVSLTLVEVAANRFSVALIPHTLAQTTLGIRQPGAAVNLEVDLIAKYVHKAVQVIVG